MNIALFASQFYPHVGGVEELCRQLAHEYRRRGVGVIVITNRWPRNLPRAERFEGIDLYRLLMRLSEGPARQRLNYRLTEGLIRRTMIKILRRHAIDLLHVQCVSGNGYWALEMHRRLRLPLVVTTQGERTMDAGRLYERSQVMRDTLRALLAEADHVTACSRDTLDDIERFYGGPLGEKSSVIYNGIRLADFEIETPRPHARPYVLGIGRLVPQKGFDVLIDAFASIASQVAPDLLIAGEGTEREALEARVRERGLAERIRFFGRADRAQAVALFQHCEFFVLPSRMEPQGIVSLEAMAAGKAVIASRTGGVPEIVREGETGLLVQPGDAGALAAAMRELAGNEGLRARLGAAGRERAKAFEWGRIAQEYLGIYQSLRPGAGVGAVRGEGLADGRRGAAIADAVPGSVA